MLQLLQQPDSLVVPEVLDILNELIDVYNNFDSQAGLVKLCSTRGEVPGSVCRYQTFVTPEELLKTIVDTCPNGITLIQSE